MPSDADILRIRQLPCWRGIPDIAPLAGGMSNRNYRVRDAAGLHVARLGEEAPHHGIERWHELAMSRAAHAAGMSPEVEHAEPGILVMRYIEGRTLTSSDLRDPGRLPAIAALIRRCHREIGTHWSGPVRTFCPFQTVRDYAAALRSKHSPWSDRLDELTALNERLQRSLPPAEPVFAHNDLLAGNLLDDGRRLWLIDWDYAARGGALFDLANLATNNGFGPAEEAALLGAYFGSPAGGATLHQLRTLRVASLLRETLWSMVSELHPAVDFDYAGYTRTQLRRLEAELVRFHGGGC